MSTFEQLAQLLSDDYGIPLGTVQPETSLSTLGLSSLDVLQLCLELEEVFAVQIDSAKASGWTTVADVVQTVEAA